MKVFHCDHCAHLVFFENTECVSCGHRLAYLPDLAVIGSLDPTSDGRWCSPLARAKGRTYTLCRNYTEHQVCNWAVSDESSGYCASCRLTRIIPDLTEPESHVAWYRLEVAKRRLVVTLLALGLPVQGRDEHPHGLAFELKADAADGSGAVLTGHAGGVITINLAEADDAERERRRKSVHEPYRTLLGHMRHESGHYYWDRLIDAGSHLERFRELFGDERRDYADALRAYYEQGAPADWQARFVSAYASAHPWEDWAETWSHYLHMVDALETAAACGLSLHPRRADEPVLEPLPREVASDAVPFDRLMDDWFPVTYLLNNLNRGLGLPDGYPFVLSPPVIEKLRFVHDVVHRHDPGASETATGAIAVSARR